MFNLYSVLYKISAKPVINKFLMLIMIGVFLSVSPCARATNTEPNPVIAVINDIKFYKSDIERARKQLPLEAQQYPDAAVYQLLLKNVINTHLVAAAARKDRLDRRENIVKQMRRIEDQVLYQAYLEERILLAVTDEKLKELYQNFRNSTADNEEIRARHILVETRDQALEVIRQLNDGADFSNLAKKLSTGPSGKLGGDLGYFSRGRMVQSFSEGAFATALGEITGQPVKTQFGWHVIKVEDKRTLKPKSFDQVKPQLRKKLIADLTASILSELRNAASIKTFGRDVK